MAPIPYARQQIDESDIAAVTAVLRGDWITQGPKVAEFEQAVAARCGARHAVACSSGTAALHLALLAGRLGPGDEAVVPALTFLATANCAVFVGATPRFADIDPATRCMTAELLAPHLSAKTRAVLPVHFAGLPCGMESIHTLVRARCPDALIVEDASHALGATHADGTPVGSLGFADMVTFSFHPVKHVAAGEGGMVLTDRDDLAARMRLMRNHGMTKDPALLVRESDGAWYYEMHEVGFNYRLTDLACALALSQLARLDRFLERRREIAARYHEAFAGTPHLAPPPPGDVARSAWHLYSPHVDFDVLGKTRVQVVAELAERDVLTQTHYYPVPLQPYYRSRHGYREGDFPGAETHYRGTLSIPMFPALTDAEVAQVVDAVRTVLDA